MKEKRYISRNTFSIEDGIKFVIEKIGDKGLKEATGKGKDTFLKMSNPTHPTRQINAQDVVKIDVYCRQKGLGSPLLDCINSMIENAAGSKVDKSPEVIHKGMNKVLEEYGDVVRETSKALEDRKVDDIERETIGKEIRDVKASLQLLEQKLELGKQHEHSKYQKRDSE